MPEPATPTEKVVVEPIAASPESPKFESGMTRQLNLSKAVKPTNGNGDKPTEPVKAVTYDYSVFKDLTDEDYKKYTPLKEKDESSYYEILSNRNDMKKYQRLVSAREQEINQLKGQKPDEELAKHKEFIEGLRKDAAGTYKRFQKDFDLPEWEFLERQVSSGNSIQERLIQFQETELIPSIEKKFKLESGTFTYSADEAYKAGTPSYEYRLQTEKYENKLGSEYESQVTRQRDVVTKVKQQTDADMKFLRETYFPSENYESPEKADEAFVGYLSELDAIQKQISEGEFNPELNPFALRHIFRGLHFDKLLQSALDKQASDIHSQYNAKGLFLPDSKQLPTNLSGVKGGAAPVIEDKNNGKEKFSPMHRRMIRNNQS